MPAASSNGGLGGTGQTYSGVPNNLIIEGSQGGHAGGASHLSTPTDDALRARGGYGYGGNGSASYPNGGGGGAYVEVLIPAHYLPNTVNILVGAGGIAGLEGAAGGDGICIVTEIY